MWVHVSSDAIAPPVFEYQPRVSVVVSARVSRNSGRDPLTSDARSGHFTMVMKTVEFWFGLSSTYSYLAAMRVEALAAAAGRRLEWRAFLLGPIFQAQQGSADSPFNRYPERGRYMWRDVERLCAKY